MYKKQDSLIKLLSQLEVSQKKDLDFDISNSDVKDLKKQLTEFLQDLKPSVVQDYILELPDSDTVKKSYKKSIESINDFIYLLTSDFFDSYESLVSQIKDTVMLSVSYILEIFE